MVQMDVMVFTPVYRLEPETVTAIMALEWEGPLTLIMQRDNPERGADTRTVGIHNHLHQYRRGREMFLAGPWEAMLVIESDIIPPANTLQRLAALEVDVAYGLYRFRNDEAAVVNVFEAYPRPARNVGESLSVKPGLYSQAMAAGRVPCSGGGFGCILIRRPVLEQVGFRVEPNAGYCDTPWTQDVWQAGFSMTADMGVVCGHKREDGLIVWPPGVEHARD